MITMHTLWWMVFAIFCYISGLAYFCYETKFAFLCMICTQAANQTVASHAGIFRGACISSLPTNACSTNLSHFTFQILESWPWPQRNPIITRSAWDFEKPLWPLINIRLRAARLTQSDFRILRALHNLSEGKNRRKKVTLGSHSGSRFYSITSL